MISITNKDDSSEEDEVIVTEEHGNGKIVLAADDDEDDFEDEPLPVAEGRAGGALPEDPSSLLVSSIASIECSDALTAIAADCWDVSSWIIFVEEVEEGRGGSITREDAYQRIIAQFPRSAKFWVKLVKHYMSSAAEGGEDGEGEGGIKNYSKAEAVLEKCLSSCRSVELWGLYLEVMKRQTVDTVNMLRNPDSYATQRERYEGLLRTAIESVGMSMDAVVIWKAYLTFVQSWPETGPVDVNRKLGTLRTVYQRAVLVPMDNSDEIWSEYEEFEKKFRDPTTDPAFGDLNRRFMHAKSICRERRRYTNGIVMDRLALPPLHSSSEIQQLDLWNNWIRFEFTNPDNLSPETFRHMIRMVFCQCLCCFRYNPEIWMCLARFERYFIVSAASGGSDDDSDSNNSSPTERARQIYLEAIEANPEVMILRTGLAELEELNGDEDDREVRETAAQKVLMEAFQYYPSGFSFASLQRFIRRRWGILAARKLFTETWDLRQNNPQIGLELFMENAKLESDVNCDLSTALKVLNVARAQYPACSRDAGFVCATTRLLALQGDISQIRWVMQTALGDLSDASTFTAAVSSLIAAEQQQHTTPSSSSSTSAGGKESKKGGNVRGGGGRGMNSSVLGSLTELRNELILREEFYRVEVKLGQCGLSRLAELRAARDRCRQAFEDMQRAKLGAVISGRDREDNNNLHLNSQRFLADGVTPSGISGSIFDSAAEVSERCCTYSRVAMSDFDRDLVLRSLGEFRPTLFTADSASGGMMLYGTSKSVVMADTSGYNATSRRAAAAASAAELHGSGSQWSGGSLGALLRPAVSEKSATGDKGDKDISSNSKSSKRGKRDRDGMLGNMSTDFLLSMAGLPVIIRELLAKLPLYNGAALDSEGFVRHVRSIVMPPRPAVEEGPTAEELEQQAADAIAFAVGSGGGGVGDDEDDDNSDQLMGAAEIKTEVDASGSNHVLVLGSSGADSATLDGHGDGGDVEDVFRQRQRKAARKK